MLIDPYDRQITYLRVSLTQRCNLRCVYCMPAGSQPVEQPENTLTADEIVRVVEVMAQQGLRYIRLTGGEPLVHPKIVEIVSRLSSIPNIKEVTLTTNAMLLEKLAEPLAKAGLDRVNISLDTLDAEKFKRVTRGGNIEKVWQGIAAAREAGLTPIKINTVAVRGVNDTELVDLANLSVAFGLHVRFIELMPVVNSHNWGDGFPAEGQRYVSIREMLERLSTLDLRPDRAPVGNGPSRTYRIPGAEGTVGFISPVGEHFCKECNRLRLTSDGFLRPCLLIDDEINIIDDLRSGKNVLPLIQKAVSVKPRGHELELSHLPTSRRMAQIGG